MRRETPCEDLRRLRCWVQQADGILDHGDLVAELIGALLVQRELAGELQALPEQGAGNRGHRPFIPPRCGRCRASLVSSLRSPLLW